jgi:short subunit dehydrogenase-like uncharacterized protein
MARCVIEVDVGKRGEDMAPSGVWILGATGRVGSGVAAGLADADVTPVLVGRDAERLNQAAARIGEGVRTVVASSEAIAEEIERQRPAVVVNTIGPFARTAVPFARACMLGGSHYVDLANDLVAIPPLLDLHKEAEDGGSTLVTGVGFGVLATEAVVAKLCEGHPTPDAVRVDAVASVEIEAGALGSALAATVVDALAGGGRRYEAGRLVKARLGGEVEYLTLPDGQALTTGGIPSGELLAAGLTSGAATVTATSVLAPTAPLARAVLPLASALVSLRPVRNLAVRRLAAIHLKPRPRPREYSWGHAVIRWPDGTSREGWLRAGDGMAFTVAVIVAAAVRLVRGGVRPGAYTPAAAFGPDIATEAGGHFILD